MMDTKWEDKVWGKTRLVYSCDFSSEHHLQVRRGGYCSFHFHHHRANRFVILSGVIRVVRVVGWTIDYTDLTCNNVFDVPSLVAHQFQVLESGEVIEQYWLDRGCGLLKNQDIVRLSKGGFDPHMVLEPGIMTETGIWVPMERK